MTAREFVPDFLQFLLRDATDQEHDEFFLQSRNLQRALGMYINFATAYATKVNFH